MFGSIPFWEGKGRTGGNLRLEMRLSLRFLNDVANANSFEYADSIEFQGGDNQTVYLQLVDASLDRLEQGFNPPGRRYTPSAGAMLSVTMVNLDDAKKVVRPASQPFPNDPSIWAMTVLPTDPIKGTVRLSMVLTETGRILHSSNVPGMFLRVW